MRYDEIISVIAIAAIILNVILIVKFMYLCKDVLVMRKDIRRIADKCDPDGKIDREYSESHLNVVIPDEAKDGEGVCN